MSLPLSKYYDPADYAELAEELAVVDQHFTKAVPQREHRRWEYAMALRAADVWAQKDYEQRGHADRTHGGFVYDVGGAGSPFYHMIGAEQTRVIDPHESDGLRLDQMIRYARVGSMVFCLSVLEHVDDLDQFLYHLSCLTAPGGLLFLTMDCCGCEDHDAIRDPHHFATMRKRIFVPWFRREMAATLMAHQFGLLGEADYSRYQPRLYGSATDPGYSFASLALVKRS